MSMMPADRIDSAIDRSLDATIQSQVSKSSNTSLIWWLARAGMYMSPWWSPQRDKDLRDFWKKTDHLAGAVFTMCAKMTAIPFRILPRDTRVRGYAKQGDDLTEILMSASQFGEGWGSFFSRFVEDLITQDNGAFAEIIGPGSPTGPLTGRPISIAHLDSARCQRTGNAEYPVIYHDVDGKTYKMHYTRVLFASQQTSPIAEMYGVGFCSVSRCSNVAQNLLDILTYKQEKLGSRPHRAILITKGGLDPTDFANAFQAAEANMDSQGLSRYSKMVVVGSSSIEDASHELIELSSLPDGFDEKTSVELGVATIALAFGMDPRELFPSLVSGASRAESVIQHIKQRGKGPGQLLEIVERLFNHKVLPPHLHMVFDFQDDAQDRQIADIKRVRAERRNIDLNSGGIDARVAREQMMESGDISEGQFEYLELEDGRLSNGVSVVALFYADDPLYQQDTDLGVEDPLDFTKIKPKTMMPKLDEKIREVRAMIINAKSTSEDTWEHTKCLTALLFLRKAYIAVIEDGTTDPHEMMVIAERTLEIDNSGSGKKTQESFTRVRMPSAGRKLPDERVVSNNENNEANPAETRGKLHPETQGAEGVGKKKEETQVIPFDKEEMLAKMGEIAREIVKQEKQTEQKIVVPIPQIKKSAPAKYSVIRDDKGHITGIVRE